MSDQEEIPSPEIVQSPVKDQPIFNIESVVGAEVILKCTCPRNGCAKAYCICFLNGRNCDPSVCQCTNCLNTGEDQQTLRKRAEFIDMKGGINVCCNCTRNGC